MGHATVAARLEGVGNRDASAVFEAEEVSQRLASGENPHLVVPQVAGQPPPDHTWTVNFDGLREDLPWSGSVVSWSSLEPTGASVTVRVRSSNDQVSWSEWVDVSSGASFFDNIFGQYLQIQSTLSNTGGSESPILYDLTIDPSCGREVPQ